MASFLVGRLVTLIVRALNRSIADDTLGALIAQGDRQVLEVALFDCFFDLVFDKCTQIIDLFACQAALFGQTFGVLYKLDLPEPLLFCDVVRGLNVLPAALHKVALIFAM
eukprot:9479684-Ditylum_brightwellii.AAC.1